MKFDKIVRIFTPKEESFFPLFEQSAGNMIKAAALLKDLMATNDVLLHEKINKEIKDYEHIGDEITDKTYEQLNKSFITPFDREDIHELAAHIDDVLDSINGVSRRICLYKPKNLIYGYREMTDLIYQAARDIEIAIHCLKDPSKHREKIMAACDRVTDIEHKADEMYFHGASQLFEKEMDTKELLKNNKILEILERCVDEEEDVTDTIKAILIKMA